MMSAGAKDAPASAGVWRNSGPMKRWLNLHRWMSASALHLALPLAVSAFACVTVFFAFLLAMNLRDETIADNVSEMEMLASTLAMDINARAKERDATEISRFEQDIPSRVLARQRQVFIANANGDVLGALPAANDPGSLLADAGVIIPVVAGFAKDGATLRLTLRDGSDAYVASRKLQVSSLRLVLLHRRADMLRDWRSNLWRIGALLAIAIALCCITTAAYFWQARRAQTANEDCESLARRMDSALSHGRCGLWDWDIARGRIHWSASMYEMLGMEVQAAPLSIGDVKEMLHPQDGDLASMAQELIASGAETVDHTFRIRNAAGEWIWLRARAEVDQSRNSVRPHLIGIALDITEQRELEEKTKTADERLRAAVETISEAFVLWDSDNRLVLYNSKFLNFHNLPLDVSHYGQHYDSVMAGARTPYVKAQYPLSFSGHVEARTYEAQLVDGRWLQVNERRTADGGFVSVGTDITSLKAHEEQLLDSERRLLATVADLRRSRQTLEVQAKQLNRPSRKVSRTKGRGGKRQSGQNRIFGQHES